MSWQMTMAEGIAASLPDDATVTVHGSAAEPERLDGWSDLDLRITLSTELDLDDLVAAPAWAFEDVRVPEGQTYRTVLADGRRLDLSISGPGRINGGQPADDNDFRFIAATAMARLGRGERLISTHLILELWQLCLVEAMMLRDLDAGTTVHRGPARHDEYAEAIMRLADGGWDPRTRPNVIERTADLFARWRSERDAGYTADWSALQALIDRGIG